MPDYSVRVRADYRWERVQVAAREFTKRETRIVRGDDEMTDEILRSEILEVEVLARMIPTVPQPEPLDIAVAAATEDPVPDELAAAAISAAVAAATEDPVPAIIPEAPTEREESQSKRGAAAGPGERSRPGKRGRP